MQGLDRYGRVITPGTFSKTLFPLLRLAWLVTPAELVKPLSQARSVMDDHSALLSQAITAAFRQQGRFASHLRLMRQLYRGRRDLLLTRLQPFSPWLTPIASPAGYNLR